MNNNDNTIVVIGAIAFMADIIFNEGRISKAIIKAATRPKIVYVYNDDLLFGC